MSDKNKVFCSAFLLGVCSFTLVAVENPAPAVKVAPALSKEARHSVSRHTVGYLEKENDASNIVKQANELFQKEEYFRARDLYIKGKKALNALNPTYFRDRIRFCDDQINLCYYEIANQALRKADTSAAVNDYDEAIRLCREAAEYYPGCRPVIEKKIARYTAIRQTVAIQKNTSDAALIPDKELQDYEISMLLRRGRALVNAGLYDKAKRIYEDILRKNPYRSDVLQDLRAVNSYIKEAGRRRRLSTRRASIAANELEWALPLQREVEKTVEAFAKPVEKAVVAENPLVNKLKAIIIPRISFDEIKLRKVLDILVNLSEQYDPSRVGINIFLRQNLAAAQQDGAPAAEQTAAKAPAANEQKAENTENAENAEEEEEEEEEQAEGLEVDDESSWTALEKTTLTLPDMVNKSLEEIIRNICTNAKLRYRVEKNVVVIEELNMPEADLETKIFPVDATSLSDAGDPNNPEDLKSYFKDKGIGFPEGSKIVFDSRINRVFATNTAENLEKIEAVCAESLNSAEGDTLVQIQLRIIEISQSDLNSLGFNYTLSDKSPTSPAFDSFSTVNQLRTDGGGGPSAHADITMGEFTLGIDVKALDDIASKDVLASPRVTTLPNTYVKIKLITETYFVEDFDESETEKTTAENGDINYTYVGPFPNFESEPEELGITFGTTPSIGNNGEITMLLEPQVSSLVGWTYYEGTNEDGGSETVRTPNIARRNMRTNVTIKDGETLVIGGVIEDNVTSRKDKVPLLGDIPLIGRLFQSRSHTSEKKNLLIFVTPRLVKPDGTFKNPENHEEHRGIARFL